MNNAKQVCTNCGKCKAACPAGIDIPAIIKSEIRPSSDFTGSEDCIECGACTACCPEKIAVKNIIREMAMKQGRAGAYAARLAEFDGVSPFNGLSDRT